MSTRFPDGKGGKKEILDRSMLKEREEIFKNTSFNNGSHFATDTKVLKIPATAKSVAAGAFLECTDLKEVDYSDINSDTVVISNINRFYNYKIETDGSTCSAIPAIIVGDKNLVLEDSISKDPLKTVDNRTNFNNDFYFNDSDHDAKLCQWVVCDDVIYFFYGFTYRDEKSLTKEQTRGPLLVWQKISEKPDDWDTNTNLYFKVENNRPVRLEQGVEWESGKYFEYISASILGQIDTSKMSLAVDSIPVDEIKENPYYYYEKIGNKFQHIYVIPDENWDQNYTDEYLNTVYVYD